MKKLVLLLVLAGSHIGAHASLFNKGDSCNPTPECGEKAVTCYDCAENKPEVLVQLEPCAYKNKPYNYYTWTKAAEKTTSSDKYNWDTPVSE